MIVENKQIEWPTTILVGHVYEMRRCRTRLRLLLRCGLWTEYWEVMMAACCNQSKSIYYINVCVLNLMFLSLLMMDVSERQKKNCAKNFF